MCLLSDFFLLIFIGSYTLWPKYTLNDVITPPSEVCTDRHEAEQRDVLSEDERDLESTGFNTTAVYCYNRVHGRKMLFVNPTDLRRKTTNSNHD